MSISAILAKAFSTTLLGMGTVFALLIVISLIIGWLRYIPVVLDRLQKPKPTAHQNQTSKKRDHSRRFSSQDPQSHPRAQQ